jgi:hypothetical protein
MSRHHNHWKIIGKKEYRIYKVAVHGAAFFTVMQLFAWAIWMTVKYTSLGADWFGVILATVLMAFAVIFFYVGAAEILGDTDKTE